MIIKLLIAGVCQIEIYKEQIYRGRASVKFTEVGPR